MTIVIEGSNSLIGNLSREVYILRMRCISILNSLLSSKDKTLISRLKSEFVSLEKRRSDILRFASYYRKQNNTNSLSTELLIEICSRPISFSPIT